MCMGNNGLVNKILHLVIYTVTLTGNTISFRGLMVQARAVADDTPLGSFQAEPDVTRLSDCSRADVGFS